MSRYVFLLFFLFFSTSIVIAAPITIEFESLTVNTITYDEGGFRFSTSDGNGFWAGSDGQSGQGLTHFGPFNNPEYIIITKIGGGTFDFLGLVANDRWGGANEAQNIVGIKAGTPTELWDPNPNSSWQGFTPTLDFTGITELRLYGNYSYDNIQLNITGVPEPSSYLLFLSFVFVFYFRKKRKMNANKN